VFFLPTLAARAVEEVADGIVSHGLLATLLVSALLRVSLLALGSLIFAILGDQLLRHAPDGDADG
jgi:hypothetical protein